MNTYPNKENFINEIKKIPKFERKYPLINSYLIKVNTQKELIKYIPDFNEFINFMIDNYSYKISREDASRKIFKKIWVNLKPFAIKYGCRDEILPIDLDENKSIDHFLNDNGEICKGMLQLKREGKMEPWIRTSGLDPD